MHICKGKHRKSAVHQNRRWNSRNRYRYSRVPVHLTSTALQIGLVLRGSIVSIVYVASEVSPHVKRLLVVFFLNKQRPLRSSSRRDFLSPGQVQETSTALGKIFMPNTMKIISRAVVSSVVLDSTVAAIEYSVGSCADLMAVDETALTSLIITPSPIECKDYLRFVARNDVTLSAMVPEVVLSNIALKIKDGLTVEIEPDIVFKDVFEVVSFFYICVYLTRCRFAFQVVGTDGR